MNAYPTPHTLQVRTVTVGPEDEFGNPTRVTAEHSWPVYFIADGSIETEDGSRDLSVVQHTIGAPKSELAPGEYDEVQVGGEWFAVNGRPKDWTRGPFGFAPGVVVELRRADG